MTASAAQSQARSQSSRILGGRHGDQWCEKRLRLTPERVMSAVIVGGLIAGAANLVYAIIAFGLTGVPATRLLQGIASGLFGEAAYAGGLSAAICGAVLHFAMSIAMAGAYVTASLRFPILLRQPMLCGALYGVALFVLMHYIVVPLSAAVPLEAEAARTVSTWALNKAGIFVHAFLVGAPIAAIAHCILVRDACQATTKA